MSIVSVNELYKERRGRESLTGVTYTRVFQVETDDVTDSPFTVKNATDIPDIGDEYPDDAAATLRDKSAVPFAEGRVNWHVTCGYSSASGAGGRNKDRRTADPLEEDPQIFFGQTQRTIAADKAYTEGDLRGHPSKIVQNKAKNVFTDPLEKEETNLLISITKNEGSFSAETAYTYKNTCNKSSITVAGVRIGEYKGRMLAISGRKMWDQNGDEYWEVHYEIEVNFKNQQLRVLNQGYYTINDNKNEDSDGAQKGEPKKLDNNGEWLAAGAAAIYLDFNIYWKLEWSGLDLPRGC